MRVEVKCVQSMPLGVCVLLVKRASEWVLYIVEDLLRRLGSTIPGATPIAPRWRTTFDV